MYTLAKQAKELNYKKLNLQVNNRIQKLRVPSALQEQVDVSEDILGYLESIEAISGHFDSFHACYMCIYVNNCSFNSVASFSVLDKLHCESGLSGWI